MSSNVIRASDFLQRGKIADALALLHQAVNNGDAAAAVMLGDLRISGQIIRRDLGEARNWYGQAAELGHSEAETIFVALLSNGAGGAERRWQNAISRLNAHASKSDWTARQAALIAAMPLTEDGDPLSLPPAQTLNAKPRIETISGILSPAECSYMIERSEGLFQPSEVIHPQTRMLIRDPIRSASVAAFPFVIEDPAIHAINRRIAKATHTIYEQGEPMQVLRYSPGEEYKLHSDVLPSGPEQRIITVLIPLNDDFSGGETAFPRLGLNWRGKAGDALIFANTDAAGHPEELAWHAGTPVTSGTKFILSKWIRGAPLDLSGPSGRPF